MNVAIIGKNQANGILKKQLASKGFVPLLIENAGDIKGVSGEKGSFAIKIRDRSFSAGYVIVTEEPEFEKAGIHGLPDHISAQPLTEEFEFDSLPSNMPVVFIVDYPFESPDSMTRIALEKAIRLVKRKRKVLYLTKFMRTAGNGMESIYREARTLGVSFIKYNSVSIEYKLEREIFDIFVADDYGSMHIETVKPVIAGRVIPGGSLEKLLKLLRLKLDKGGLVNEGRSFLFPSLSSRKGVYFLNTGPASGQDEEVLSHIQYTLSEIMEDFQKDSKFDTSCARAIGLPGILRKKEAGRPEEVAVIDEAKCAFCYTCFRACPHAAMIPGEQSQVMKNLEQACHACGICSAVCPANAIKIVRRESRAGTVPAGTLKIFCCENSGSIAVRKIQDDISGISEKIEITPVSCGGELSAESIVSALKNFDKVLVTVCMDDACRHFEGNKRAARQAEKAKELLKASGMDESRVEYLQVSLAMPDILCDTVWQMLKEKREVLP